MTKLWGGALTRRGMLASGAALGVASCSGLIGPPPAPQLYVLHPDFPPTADAPAVPWQLTVAVPVTPESLDTGRIALMRAPNVMDYYASSAWTDSVPQLVQSLLVEAFQRSGKIAAVGRDGQGIRSDCILQTEIRDFEAYYAVADAPPKVRVNIAAALVGAPRREVLSTLQVRQEVQAAANNLPSITAAFTQATGAAIEEIVAWVLRTPVPAARTAEMERETPAVVRTRRRAR
jgi:cholesterol transport system auxiliary component